MQFEKVRWTRFDTASNRTVAVSLPRVHWLERDAEHRPSYAFPPVEVEDCDDEAEPLPAKGPARVFRPEARTDELSDRERRAWGLYRSGKKLKDVAAEMGITSQAAKKLAQHAREKLGLGLR